MTGKKRLLLHDSRYVLSHESGKPSSKDILTKALVTNYYYGSSMSLWTYFSNRAGVSTLFSYSTPTLLLAGVYIMRIGIVKTELRCATRHRHSNPFFGAGRVT